MAPATPETPQPEAPEATAAWSAGRRPMWELAECNCPEFCERDHELD